MHVPVCTGTYQYVRKWNSCTGLYRLVPVRTGTYWYVPFSNILSRGTGFQIVSCLFGLRNGDCMAADPQALAPAEATTQVLGPAPARPAIATSTQAGTPGSGRGRAAAAAAAGRGPSLARPGCSLTVTEAPGRMTPSLSLAR